MVEPVWASAVRVERHPELASRIVRQFPASRGRVTVWVTDLLDLRAAYWRGRAEVPLAPERKAQLDLGRAMHSRIARLLAPPDRREVRFRRDGIVGQVDALEDVPTEIKTTSGELPGEELLLTRLAYVEQLGLYCALAGRSEGRLLVARTEGARVVDVGVYSCGFPDPAKTWRAMECRAHDLRSSWVAGTPQTLPRCGWFDRGCEVRAASLCDCTGAETPPTPLWPPSTISVRGDHSEEARWSPQLRSIAISPGAPTGLRSFRDLLYPRRRYYADRQPTIPTDPGVRARPRGAVDLFGELTDALESILSGEVSRGDPVVDEPAVPVPAWRGLPYLLRTSRAWDPLRSETLAAEHPQYALELAFRCVATGVQSGYLVIGYERAAREEDRVGAFRMTFDPVSLFARIWRSRQAALARALSGSSPEELLACPSWMATECPYRTECGCGTAGGSERAHR